MTRIHDKIGCGVSTSLCDAGGVASCSESELDLTGNHFGMPLISSPEIMSDCNRAVRKPRKSKLTSTNQPDLETWFRVRLGALSRRDRITGQVARDSFKTGSPQQSKLFGVHQMCSAHKNTFSTTFLA